jgi:putative sterol carrier protein
MTVRRFQLNVDDPTYAALVDRAQAEGKQVDQILEDLLESYANGQTAGFTTYTVQGADTLAQIARKVYGDPYKYPVILNANQLDPSGNIFVGQVLVIPVITPAGSAPVPAPVPVPSTPIAPAPAPVPAPAAGPTLTDYVNAMPKGFRADRAGNLQATYQFQLSGTGGGTWTVYVANGSCTVAQGGTPVPSVGIGMGSDDFIKLAQGKLDTTQAYRQGRVKIGGDLNLAARIADIFGSWAQFVSGGATPAAPAPPTPAPLPSVPAPTPAPGGTIHPTLLNGSFDDYRPFMRDGQAQYWKEPRFPEEYGQHWELKLDREKKGRTHIVSSKTFGEFTAKYFGGGGRDYHIHGRHSQVVASQYYFDVIFSQTVAAQPGKNYTFSGAIVSFYKGTSGERADGKIFKTIGIDPTGGRDFKSPTVVWGDRDGKDNEWRYPSIRVAAQSAAITVFIRLENVEENVGQTELNIVHLENFTLG